MSRIKKSLLHLIEQIAILTHLVGLDGGPRVEVLDDRVGVDGDEDVGHVGVDLVLEVALPDVVEQGGLVEVHETAVVVHRLGVVILGRVEAVKAANGNDIVSPFSRLIHLHIQGGASGHIQSVPDIWSTFFQAKID